MTCRRDYFVHTWLEFLKRISKLFEQRIITTSSQTELHTRLTWESQNKTVIILDNLTFYPNTAPPKFADIKVSPPSRWNWFWRYRATFSSAPALVNEIFVPGVIHLVQLSLFVYFNSWLPIKYCSIILSVFRFHDFYY